MPQRRASAGTCWNDCWPRRTSAAGRRRPSTSSCSRRWRPEPDGDSDAATTALRRAITLAEPEGHVRAFARHGMPLAPLLDGIVALDGSSPYVEGLRLAALRTSAAPGTLGATPPRPAPRRTDGLVEPLSPRELEVLRLLASDLDGPDIARHLVVSLNTLRTHTKNIYAKLGVSSRRAALRRAHELGVPLSG